MSQNQMMVRAHKKKRLKGRESEKTCFLVRNNHAFYESMQLQDGLMLCDCNL